MKIYTADRETGTFIEEVGTIEEGLALIVEYEDDDEANDVYVPNFYDIVDEHHNSLIYQ